jgi:uncharacterized membrane protein (DUF106 family)
VLDRLSDFIVRVMDLPLGWLLRLPSDVQLFIVAIGSALILAVVRKFTSNQDLLRRCRADQTRQKALLREAKARKDGDAVKRHRATLGMIAIKQFRQEGGPMLASLLPIVLLATWAFHRLEFHPPAAGEPVEFTASFPISAVGKITHIAPVEGVAAPDGWLREIVAVTDHGPAHGEATWRVSAAASPAPHVLRVRYGGQTYEHPLQAGAPTYEPAVKTHDERLTATEVKLRPVKLFGVVPSLPALFFPPWLVAYLLIVIPSVPLIKRVLRIC